MNDAALVCGFERFADLFRDWKRFDPEDRPTLDSLLKCLAVDQLHHDARLLGGVFEAVNVRNVGMIQRREDFRFTLESREAIGVGSDLRGEKLQRDFAMKFRVERSVDHPHAAFAELRLDFIRADAGSARKHGAILRTRFTSASSNL